MNEPIKRNSNEHQSSILSQKALWNFLHCTSTDKINFKNLNNHPQTNYKSFQSNACSMKTTKKDIYDVRVNCKFSEVSTEIGNNNTRFQLLDMPSFYTFENSRKLPKIKSILSIRNKIDQVNQNKQIQLTQKVLEKKKTIKEKEIKAQSNKDNLNFEREKKSQYKRQREEMRNTKLKLYKIITKEPKNYCTEFEDKVNIYNDIAFDSLERTNYLQMAINKSKDFHFSSYHSHCYSIGNDYDSNNCNGNGNELAMRVMDLYKNKPQSTLTEKLTNELTEKEKKMIMNDPQYFLCNFKELKNHPVLVPKPLSKIITEEEEKKDTINSKKEIITYNELTTEVYPSLRGERKKKTLSFDKASQTLFKSKDMTSIEKRIIESKEALRKSVYNYQGIMLKEYQSTSKPKEAVEKMITNMSHKIFHLGKNNRIVYEKPVKPIKLMRREKKESLLVSNYMRLKKIKRKQMINNEKNNEEKEDLQTLKSVLRLIKGNIANSN